jgi:hypothetical protein
MYRFLTVVAAYMLSVSVASADMCKHRITFLPQTHPVPNSQETSYSDEQESIARSQHQIAKYIDANPMPVFSEQMTKKDVKWSDIPEVVRPKLVALMSEIFPEGIPENFNDLSNLQKWKFVANGGELIELMRQKIERVHRVLEDAETADKVFSPFDAWLLKEDAKHLNPYPPDIRNIVYTNRERLALEQINKFFQAHPEEKDVILIFGGNHNFNLYPYSFNPDCVVVPDEFKSEWLGSSRTW